MQVSYNLEASKWLVFLWSPFKGTQHNKNGAHKKTDTPIKRGRLSAAFFLRTKVGLARLENRLSEFQLQLFWQAGGSRGDLVD